MTLETCMQPFDDNTTYVVTGDIDAMWIRDSAAQLEPYITVAAHEGPSSRLWPLLQGALRSQAKFILTDPYANAFTRNWNSAQDERLERGAYVFTGNYELDSGAYFIRFINSIAKAYPDAPVLKEKPVHEAVKILVAMYRQEQRHANGKSSYQYPKWEPWELPGEDGRGNPVAYTGMVWGAFRPSDDAQQYGYNIAGNVFLASELKHVVRHAQERWQDKHLAERALKLRADIIAGVKRFGKVQRPGGEVYCYEVDGLGNCAVMDDANIPSLLSLPYLDPKAETFDMETYRRTRKVILSSENPWFFQGEAGHGIGSPHTGPDMIWPLALVMEAMTAPNASESEDMLKMVVRPRFPQGLPESFNKDNVGFVTRHWFGWPNALLANYLISTGRCKPVLQGAKYPEVRPAPRDGPLKGTSISFYDADVKLLRRQDVLLPTMD